jgi:hypothetical protein
VRQDTRTLLERLKRDGSFQYCDFDDASPDGDVWPMFEALLGDPRVVGDGALDMVAVEKAPTVATPAVVTKPRAGGLFKRYEAQASPGPEAEPTVRDLLDRLAHVA